MYILNRKDWTLAISLGISIGLLFSLFLIVSVQSYFSKNATLETLYAHKHAHLLDTHLKSQLQSILHQNINTLMDYQVIDVRITFYSGLAIENGGYEEKNALGQALKVGSLAAPMDIPFGTTFILEDLPEDVGTRLFTVDDRGGAISRIDHRTIKLDVYVPRNQYESDAAYYKRVNDLGVIYREAFYKTP